MGFNIEQPKGTDPGESEMSWGRGVRPRRLLDAKPEDGAMYRPLAHKPTIENGRQIRPKRGDGGNGCAGVRVAR
jgi:hypothetical protein